MHDPDLYAQVLGATLTQLRERAGLRQRALADQVGISHSMMSRIESGEAQLASFVLMALCQKLGTDQGEVLRLVDAGIDHMQKTVRLTLRASGKDWWTTTRTSIGPTGTAALTTFVVAVLFTQEAQASTK